MAEFRTGISGRIHVVIGGEEVAVFDSLKEAKKWVKWVQSQRLRTPKGTRDKGEIWQRNKDGGET